MLSSVWRAFWMMPLVRVVAVGPFQEYLTEPHFRTPFFFVNQTPSDHSLLAPGLIFLTFYVSDWSANRYGPQIFTSDGELVWNGHADVKARAMDAHVCDYLGEKGNHICYNDAKSIEQKGHSSGVVRFFDNTYTQVGNDFGGADNMRGPDIHELETPTSTHGKTFLQDVFQVRTVDLTSYGGKAKGQILDGCFQEIDIRSKAVVFEWCASDHVPLWHTYIYMWGQKVNVTHTIGGWGTWYQPWDWFHINSVSRNEEGDFLVSGRHLDAVFKIAGKNNSLGRAPGELIWTLGGKGNNFWMESAFNFSRQHHARFQHAWAQEETISLFNNAFDGKVSTARYSAGQLISLCNTTMRARLLTSYDNPNGIRAFSQGSLQTLSNTNVLISWGETPWLSEFSADGSLLWHVRYGGGVQSFRAWKHPWVGKPITNPKVLAYSHAPYASSMLAYISWNGATEVDSWVFYTSCSTSSGPWTYAGTYHKTGFETLANLSSFTNDSAFAHFVYADALDGKGRVLGTSNAVQTWTPNVEYRSKCNETRCEKKWFEYDATLSDATLWEKDNKAGVWMLVALLVTLEFVMVWLERWFEWGASDRLISKPAAADQGDGVEVERSKKGNTEIGDEMKMLPRRGRIGAEPEWRKDFADTLKVSGSAV